MSYILDALRKSERERKRSSIPDPLSVQGPLPLDKKRRHIRSYLIVVIVLLSTLVSGLWFGIWYGKNTPMTQDYVNRAVTVSQARNPQESVLESNSKIDDEPHHAVKRDVTISGKLPPDISNPQASKKSQGRPVQRGEETTPDTAMTAPAPATLVPGAEKEIPPPDKNILYSIQELPAPIRQKLPDFSFSVFLYSDEPASRTVRVNGVMMKEGQYVTDGLKLEEIIPNGVIFSYMNYRFRVGIP
jgi:general secretion pathway protein B